MRLRNPPKFLLAGDKHQFGPIANTWRGAAIGEEALWESSLLHTMCGGRYVQLEKCVRSDKRLYEFYSSLLAGGSRFALSLQDVVDEGKRMFIYGGEICQYLVISHLRRVSLNRLCNDRDRQTKRGPVLRLSVPDTRARRSSAQSCWLLVGLKMLGVQQLAKRLEYAMAVLTLLRTWGRPYSWRG